MNEKEMRELLAENAYLKGIIVGMHMAGASPRENANDYIPKLALPDFSAETAQVPAQLPSLPPDRWYGKAALLADVQYDVPDAEIDPEPEPGPKKPKKPKSAEEMYPWPKWEYGSLPPEKKSRYETLHSRKYGAGSIIREHDGRLEKLCPGCLEYKSTDVGYSKDIDTKDGVATYCRKCVAELSGIYRERKRYRAGLPGPVPVLQANKGSPKHTLYVDTFVCACCNIEKSVKQFEKIRFSDGYVTHSAMCVTCKEKADKHALQNIMQKNAILSPTRWSKYQGEWVQAREHARDKAKTIEAPSPEPVRIEIGSRDSRDNTNNTGGTANTEVTW